MGAEYGSEMKSEDAGQVNAVSDAVDLVVSKLS